jgi:hypothetical protein
LCLNCTVPTGVCHLTVTQSLRALVSLASQSLTISRSVSLKVPYTAQPACYCTVPQSLLSTLAAHRSEDTVCILDEALLMTTAWAANNDMADI